MGRTENALWNDSIITIGLALFFPATLSFTMLWNAAAYIRYERFVSFYSRDLRASVYNMYYNDVALNHTSWNDRNNFTPFFKESVREGWYQPPLSEFPVPGAIKAALARQKKKLSVKVEEKLLMGEVNKFGCHEKLILNNYGERTPGSVDAAVLGKERYLAVYRNNQIYLVAYSTTQPLFRQGAKVKWQAQLPLCRLQSGSHKACLLLSILVFNRKFIDTV